MNKSELRKKLNQPYTQENWKDVVEFVFPHFSEFSGNQSLPIAPKDQSKVESFKQIGQVRLADGKNLALFELKLKENVNIIRNRVALNDIVSSYIDQEQIHGVLSIFEQGKEDYRFTFSARASEFDEEKGDFKTKATDTKRFTYVLGKNESCKTPAERFFQLSQQKDKADIQAIEHAFSVETLSKNFFKEYKQQYELFVDYLTQTPSYFTAVFNNDDKAIRDWVKLLLGRLVFIKFVQKKGWLGVPATEKGWQYGNYRFLEENFENFEHQDNFYSQFLNPLFFDGFDAPNRPNDVFESTGTKVPFLSGGLFDNEDPKTKTINFPKEYFAGLFEFLERYNFTIDENDTAMDREVGIDPEMLGHIFENLLEDNKDKGAFYTPKEIVRYMCQESLKEYLKTYLQKQNQWATDEAKQQELEESLHKFITLKEAAGVIDLDSTLAQALKDVKICDPAIGSGAFPMGLLNEIFQLVHKLYDASPDKVGAIWQMDSWQPDVVKLNIIQQSIYGVDIEKGAVEIARLRFWLSLVVDSDEPHALPHLEYKIVVGDSLVSKLEDTIIDIDWEVTDDNSQTDLWGNTNVEQRKAILEEITKKQKLIFNPDCDDEALSVEIRNLKIDLLINQLELMIKTQGLEDKPTVQGKNLKKQTELWLQTKGWKQQIQRLKQMKAGSKTPLEFFDWKLDFPEIMNPEITIKTGFDIVIGNPPYGVSIKGIEREGVVNNWGKVPDYEIYYFFIELAYSLLKDNGTKSYIIPNTYLFNIYAEKYRIELADNWELTEILDCTKFEIFNSATVRNTINLWKKGSKDVLGYRETNQVTSFKTLIKNNRKKVSKSSLNNFSQNWALLFNLKPEVSALINKIKNGKKSLVEYFPDISQGLIAYDKYQGQSKEIIESRAYHFTKFRKGLKKWLKGGDVTEYKLVWNNEHYIDYCDGLANPRDPKFFNGTRLLIREITNPKIFSAITSDEFYNDPALIIIKESGEYSIKVLLAILNSMLLTFYHFNYSPKSTKGAFPKILIKDVKDFPIPIISNPLKEELEKLVREILKENSIAHNKGLIDNLVYKLYGLNYDEVLIIEPAFSERMSKSEYEALEVE